MKRILFFITVFLSAVSIISCSTDVTEAGGDSTIIGKVSFSNVQITGDYQRTEAEITTYAVAEPDPANFALSIYDANGTEVKSWASFAEVDPVIGLGIGNYRAVATLGTNESVAFDAPYYRGEQEFTVDPDRTSVVNLTATCANMKLTVNYSTKFLEHFGNDENLKIAVISDDYNTDTDSPKVEFKKDNVKPIYLKPAPFRILVSTSSQSHYQFAVTEVAPANHYIVTLDVKEVGSVAPSLEVDLTTNDIKIEIEVPTDEEDLGNGGEERPDGPEDDGTPYIVGEGFDIDKTLTLTDADISGGTPVKVSINAQKGIGSLVVRIDSPDLGMELLNPLFEGDSFDLANPTELQSQNLVTLGILSAGQVVKGATQFNLDVTGFMGLLPVNAIPHKFHVTLTDTEGNTVNKILEVSRVE